MTECEKVICKMYLEDMRDNCNENRLLLQMLEAEPCEDAISRQAAVNIASGFCHPANIADELAKLPPVNPQPKTDVLDKIRADVKQMIPWDKTALSMKLGVLKIIDKYKAEVEPQESEEQA